MFVIYISLKNMFFYYKNSLECRLVYSMLLGIPLHICSISLLFFSFQLSEKNVFQEKGKCMLVSFPSSDVCIWHNLFTQKIITVLLKLISKHLNPFLFANERTEMKLKIYLSEAWMCSEFGMLITDVEWERVNESIKT